MGCIILRNDKFCGTIKNTTMFTKESLKEFYDYVKNDSDFVEKLDSLDIENINNNYVLDMFLNSLLMNIEHHDIAPLDKKYLDVSYYVLDKLNGEEYILDMDYAWEVFADFVEELYDYEGEPIVTYDIYFHNDTDSNNLGMVFPNLKEAKDYIEAEIGTDTHYFKEYKGGTVQVVHNITGNVAYETSL